MGWENLEVERAVREGDVDGIPAGSFVAEAKGDGGVELRELGASGAVDQV